MRTFKYALLLFLMAFTALTTIEAKKKLQPVYLVGYAFSIIDSTAYQTQVQYMDSTWVDSKAKTLYYRVNYTIQFQSFLEGKMNCSNVVCAVMFDKKRARLEKKLQRIHRHQQKNGVQKFDVIPSATFQFQTENWSDHE